MLVLAPFFTILIFVSSQTGFSVHSHTSFPPCRFSLSGRARSAAFEIRPFTRKTTGDGRNDPAVLFWSVGSSLAVYPAQSCRTSTNWRSCCRRRLTHPIRRQPQEMMKQHGVLSRSAVVAGPATDLATCWTAISTGDRTLFYLEDWYESHPEARPIKVAYFGSYPLDQSKVKSAGYPADWSGSRARRRQDWIRPPMAHCPAGMP